MALVFTIGIAAIGMATLHTGHAATPTARAEAEKGNLAGTTRVVGDSAASGGLAVAFGSATPSNTRNPLQQPFSSNSIWNMPIGSNAQYVPAGLTSDPENDAWAPMPQIDDEYIIMTPTAPLTPIMYNGAGWSGNNRCTSGGRQLTQAPIPSNFVVPNNGANNSAAILSADGRTIIQSQPFTRCTAGSFATSLLTFANVDLYGTGITGSHGGSGLSALGGDIRVGELRPGQQGPRHALKVNVDSPYDLYKCTTIGQCYRWPAVAADSGAVGDYGSADNNQNTAMKMGALLALPASVNINSIGLESEPGKEIAWTLQNYGAYIVDSTGGAAFAIEAENGPSGSLRAQFQGDYGIPFEERVNDNTPWSRDLQRLLPLLNVVNNNSSASIGGGGTPRQPLAPAISP